MTSLLIRGGLVVDTDPIDVSRSDVLVRDGRIAAVGPGLEAPPGAEVLEAQGRIVLPGFVDTHRHTWQAAIRGVLPDTTLGEYLARVLGELAPRYQPDDVYTGVLAGALECLDSGITTLVDWSHIQLTPEHTDANLAALRESGIRAVFGYCYGGDGDLAPEARRVREAVGGMVSMAIAALGPDIVPEGDRPLREWQIARELDVPVTSHMGASGPEQAERGLAFLEENGLLTHPTTFVHATDYTDEAFGRIADSGGTVSVSPGIEAALGGFGHPPTGRARAAGVPTGLSADTIASGTGDMFSLMRAAHLLERGRPGDAGLGFTTRDVLRMATIEGARVAGLADVTGSLRPGKWADLVLLRTDLLATACAHDPVTAVVQHADTRNVDAVLVGGRVVKRDGCLVHDVTSLLTALADSSGRILG
ncbi:amidohydrolase family protein [Spirillospora sp. CA-294931]|uniref:amidohydrolase family protein n=1 Tax=Spirillospora sp. CA-294931 TaxID=3240042 RepID=UPI003D93FD1A